MSSHFRAFLCVPVTHISYTAFSPPICLQPVQHGASQMLLTLLRVFCKSWLSHGCRVTIRDLRMNGCLGKIIRQITPHLLQTQNKMTSNPLTLQKTIPITVPQEKPLYFKEGVTTALESPHVRWTSFLGPARVNLLLPGPSLLRLLPAFVDSSVVSGSRA